MHGLLERTIRAERDTRDKKEEEGIVDLISPSPGDEFCTASVIINEKKSSLLSSRISFIPGYDHVSTEGKEFQNEVHKIQQM